MAFGEGYQNPNFGLMNTYKQQARGEGLQQWGGPTQQWVNEQQHRNVLRKDWENAQIAAGQGQRTNAGSWYFGDNQYGESPGYFGGGGADMGGGLSGRDQWLLDNAALKDQQRQDEIYKKIMGMLDSSGGERPTGTVPDAWDAGSVTLPTGTVPQSSIDPMEVIRAQQPILQRQTDRALAEAAMRSGARGGLQGTGYVNANNRAALEGQQNLNALTMQLLGQHAESQAQRDMAAQQAALDRQQQAQQAALDRSLSAWGTHGGWDLESQNLDWNNRNNNLQMLMQLYGGY